MGYFSIIRERKSALIGFFALLVIGAIVSYILIPKEIIQLSWEVPGLPEDYPLVYKARPWLIGIACFIPALLSGVMLFTRILDRYLMANILTTFTITTGVIFLIWLLADFSDNVSDISKLDNPLLGLFRFYLNQIPMVLSMILPYSLLLAALWTLSSLSRNCEITPMLQSGQSLFRIMLPIIVVGFTTAIYTTIFNYQWAPSATLYRSLTFDDIRRIKSQEKNHDVDPIIYRNDEDNRIWTIEELPSLDNPYAPFKGVRIELFSAPGRLQTEYFAETATWNSTTREWTLHNARIRRHLDESEKQATEDPVLPLFDKRDPKEPIILPYRETPWLLITPGVKIDTRSVPDLISNLETKSLNAKDRLLFRTHKHLRFAQGFSAFVLVLLAIPGGINFSRRSNLSGIGIALGLSGFMIFSFQVFPALASSGYMAPFLGAWLPNIIFLIIGITMFYRKLAHRNLKDYLVWKKDQKENKNLTSSPSTPE